MADYDVILLPTYAKAESYRKRLADGCAGGAFRRTVTTFDDWIADVWELHGTGEHMVSSAVRNVLMHTLFDASETAGAAGMATLAAQCMRAAAGVPAFEEALKRAEDADALSPLSGNERSFLARIAEYERTLEALGLIEPGRAAMALARRADDVFVRGLRVGIVGDGPLSWLQESFFALCSDIDLAIEPCGAAQTVLPAPDGVDVRFAFPAGKLAQPGLVGDVVCASDDCESVVVACKDPLGLYEALAERLAAQGWCACVQARKPFGRTDFGKAFLGLYRSAHIDPWDREALSDVILSSFSGFSHADAYRVDASLRADRIADRDEVLAQLGALSDTFSLLQELADDPQADVVLGLFEQMAQTSPSAGATWRGEQLAAMGALRDVTTAARSVGAAMATCADVLEQASVSVSFRAATQGRPIVFTTNGIAAQMEPGSCSLLIVTDLTAQDYPVADKDNAASTLFSKLGLTPRESALTRARRDFNAMLKVPDSRIVLVRPLGDVDAEATYPCAVLEEFVDAYRADPSATQDIDNPFRLPPSLQPGLVQRGEELLYANAGAADGQAVQPEGPSSVVQPMHFISDETAPRVIVRRIDGDGNRIERPCPSPSQIEAYLECPFKWFAQRRLHVEQLGEGFGPLEKGSFAHAAFEAFYRRFQEVGHLKVNQDNLDEARSVMRAVLAELVENQRHAEPQSGRLVAATELEQREIGLLCSRIVAFLDVEATLLPTFTPTYFEYGITVERGADYAGYGLVGTVDRIDVDERGRAVIIDYKSSLGPRYRIGNASLHDVGKVQTRIYAQVIKRLLGLDVVGSLYVGYGKTPELAGSYDPRHLEAAHLPHMRHDACACGLAECLPDPPPADASLASLAYDAMLDETERAVGRAIRAMESGAIAPNPVDSSACRYCPVLACQKRGA